MENLRVVTVVLAACCVGALAGEEFFVAPGGNDAAAGTAAAPFATVPRAIEAARKAGGANTVTLRPGTYRQERPLALDARDSGLTVRAEKPGTAILSGGVRITGWKREAEGPFWYVDLPEAKDGGWSFRTLAVNGEFAPRACFPGGTNRFENLGDWNLPLLPALAGHWERKPTVAELTTMPYKAEDLPDTLDFRSAEVRLYHMWAESISTVASNDLKRHVIYLSTPAAWPMGACGRRKYEVFNVREGMKEPGQWYLDRTRGRVVYWPKAGEDMAKAEIVAPRMEQVVTVTGTSRERVRNVTLAGLVVESATPPLRRAGFGGGDMSAAVQLAWTTNALLDHVEVRLVGGSGIVAQNAQSCRILSCDVHHVGAHGVGLGGSGNLMERTRICHVGLMFPSSSVVGVSGKRTIMRGCEVFDGPYSGIIGSGEELLFENNLIHHVMRVLHDGAAIYGNMTRSVMRGNVARDITPNGKGFGAAAYYYDEGATDSVVERNVAIGVARPVHHHMTRNTQVRDNVFVSGGDMTISFQNSVGCTFERNTCVLDGQLRVTCPEAVRSWADNRVYRTLSGGERTEIGNAAPEVRQQGPQGALHVPRVETPPSCDGEFAGGEWPGKWYRLDRDGQRRLIGGPTSFVRAAWDGTNLYVGVLVTNFRLANFTEGTEWGADDGVEVMVAGKTFRAYACGKFDATAFPGGVSAHAGRRKGWKPWDWSKPLIYEVAIPFAALGVKPAPGAKLPFNAHVHNGEFGEDRWWEPPCPFRDGTVPQPTLMLK
ncbi:MAG: right-handed parallel beta-helix repeat-containing protein [Kiritimatiellae bacterium]|nr:right-handed parallel beta-helix repeat-containing protein [Kiritimatiellia bacterium]